MSDDEARRRPRPLRAHPWFARFYERIAVKAEDAWEASIRDELCADLTGAVLEVGAGNGLNFAHYRRAGVVVACEPEPNMLRLAQPRADAAPVPVRLVRGSAEEVPFPDETFDAVVCSLMLCSVRDPAAAVAEIRRVLRPGGVIRLYEHVRSPNRRLARIQDLIERPWGWFGGGCHPNRDTVGELERGGFVVDVRPVRVPIPGSAVLPHVLGEGRIGAVAR
ncbi:MAG: class I SAM-dependent methyltransferase [Actinomycetota bacterium]